MSLKCRVRVNIEGLAPDEAEAVRGALEPDNVGMPDGLHVAAAPDGGDPPSGLILEFFMDADGGRKEGEGRDDSQRAMGRLIGTVDEVLEHVQVALKVIRRC